MDVVLSIFKLVINSTVYDVKQILDNEHGFFIFKLVINSTIYNVLQMLDFYLFICFYFFDRSKR